MNQETVVLYLSQLKDKYNVRLYTPYKYFDGLTTRSQVKQRFLEMLHYKNDTNNFKNYKTDQLHKTRPSGYTKEFYNRYGSQYKTLTAKSKITGVPLMIIEDVYKRGMAAWKGGHRVGASQQQWAFARVHSFLTFGCTIFGPDFDLFQQACHRMPVSKLQEWLSYPIKCPKSKFTESHYYQKRIGNYKYIVNLKNKIK